MALTPDSLVASLHQHLSHHATQLPALHAQLGLPPSALALELEHLHSTLRQVVDAQLTARNKEVDEWMAQCDVVERECLDLVRCLGTTARSVQSVGELRKVQVLPTRHEQLLVLQDKLLQLYQTKTDQLTTLTNRLTNLTRTLGTSFFSPDVLPPPPSDPSTPTPTPRIPVTPEHFQRLEKEVMRGKAEISQRLSQLSSTLELIVWFYTELGLALPTPDVTSEPVTTSEYEQILARFVARWEEAEDEGLEGDTLGVEGVDPTTDIMEWAEGLKTELEEVKAHRESQIQTVFDQLEGLWKRLGTSEDEIDGFVDANRGSTEENVEAYHTELERMLGLKRESMSVFIHNARAEIVGLWDDLILGDDDRAEFTAFIDDEYTEELLARHEEEINRLKDERRIKAPLLASINKYFEICEDERKLAESANDQTRLLGRGPRDPGRLLREEKMRKRVKKEKPKLEHDLLQSIPQWENERGRLFLINGVRVVDVLMESAEAGASKENKKKPVAAPKTVPSRATTPVSTHHPLPSTNSRKHAATPATAPAAKRQKVSGPTPSTRSSAMTATPMTGGRPFGNSQAGNRVVSSSSVGGKTPGLSVSVSSSKPQHLGIGLGAPSGGFGGRSTPSQVSGSRAASGPTTMTMTTNTGTARVAAARKRESFRPRASMDSGVFGMGGLKNFGRIPGGRLVDVDEAEDAY